MGAQKQRSDDLAERFLEYLHEERAIAMEQKRAADRAYLDASKRLRELEREIATIKGGAM